MNRESMAQKLRDLRGSIPRETVSKAVGVSVSALAMYENGARVPRPDIMIEIAKFYGKSVTYIFFDD